MSVNVMESQTALAVKSPREALKLINQPVGKPLNKSSVHKAAPRYTFAGKRPYVPKPGPPGPGAYSAEALEDALKYSASPMHSFQPPLRPPSNPDVPGPGAYRFPLPGDIGTNDGLTMPRSSRGDFSARKAETPGPGTHEALTHISDGRKSAIGMPWPEKAPNGVPGPGEYGPIDEFGQDAAHHSMPGKARELKPRSADIPGPGTHETQGCVGEGPKFSHGLPRRKDFSKVPGPGSYELGRSMDSLHRPPNWSVGTSQRKEFKKFHTPGPGTHERSTSIGEGPRFSHGMPRTSNTSKVPGPGQYDLALSMDSLHRPPNWSVGTSNRKEYKKMDTPGPGSHEQSTSIGEGPKFSHGMPRRAFDSKVPGPGSYELALSADSLHSPPNWRVGTSERKEFKKMDTPGPGTHEKVTSIGEGPKFSHGLPRQTQENKVPGPGTYELALSADSLHSPPNWGVGTSERKEFKKMDTPGPGTHEQATSIGKGPKFSHGLPRQTYDNLVPGPGSYELALSADSLHTPPTWGVGTSERKEFKKFDTPGPGTHENGVHMGDDTPQFSIGAPRKEPRPNGVPGPGHYGLWTDFAY